MKKKLSHPLDLKVSHAHLSWKIDLEFENVLADLMSQFSQMKALNGLEVIARLTLKRLNQPRQLSHTRRLKLNVAECILFNSAMTRLNSELELTDLGREYSFILLMMADIDKHILIHVRKEIQSAKETQLSQVAEYQNRLWDKVFASTTQQKN